MQLTLLTSVTFLSELIFDPEFHISFEILDAVPVQMHLPRKKETKMKENYEGRGRSLAYIALPDDEYEDDGITGDNY